MYSRFASRKLIKRLVICTIIFFIFSNFVLNATLPTLFSTNDYISLPNLANTKIILHVTKELKPIASVGGVGSVVAGLSQAQANLYKDYEIWVVMPHYSFITARMSPFYTVSVECNGQTVTASVSYMKHGPVHVVLIGPGDIPPLDLLWQTQSQLEIYSNTYPLTYTHRDIFFSAAVLDLAQFMVAEGALKVIHIHGSTNGLMPGMVAKRIPESQRPVTVYTLHDYVYEPGIVLEASVAMQFPLAIEVIKNNIYYPCLQAILQVDIVTAVSDGMVQGILSGEIPFQFKEVMLERYFHGDLIGIANSIEPELNPFKNKFLIENRLAFSRHEPLTTTKQKAKDKLYPDVLASNSLPLIAFVGRLEYVKGVDMFEAMAKLSQEHNFQFVVVGSYTTDQRTSWEYIKSSILRYSNVRVIDTPQDQKKYGLIIRLAADFMFVPSKMESFGLVAVEACKFGSIPIVNDVPGLRTAIYDYDKDVSPLKNQWTGFVFNKKSKPIEFVVESALSALIGLEITETEYLLRRLVNAYMDWEEGTAGSSVAQYMNTYTETLVKKACTNCTDTSISKNLILNGSFKMENGSSDTHVQTWQPYQDGYTIIPVLGRIDSFSITMPNIQCNDDKITMGATQTVDLGLMNPRMILVSGWSKADKVFLKNSDPSSYCIFVDVYYTDNSTHSDFVPFSTKTHPWEYRQLYMYFEKQVDYITITCRFTDACGIVYFDDISLLVKK